MIVSTSAGSRCHIREHFELHPCQLFEWQIFEKCPAGRGQIMLDWIGEGEKVAAGVFQTVAQRDQFLPAVDRDQPAKLQIAFEFFRFDSKIDNVAVRPNEWAKRLDVSRCRSILFTTMHFDRASLAQFDGNNSRRWICTEKDRVLLKFHR